MCALANYESQQLLVDTWNNVISCSTNTLLCPLDIEAGCCENMKITTIQMNGRSK